MTKRDGPPPPSGAAAPLVLAAPGFKPLNLDWDKLLAEVRTPPAFDRAGHALCALLTFNRQRGVYEKVETEYLASLEARIAALEATLARWEADE